MTQSSIFLSRTYECERARVQPQGKAKPEGATNLARTNADQQQQEYIG